MQINVVREDNFHHLLGGLAPKEGGFDTETFGVEFGDELFSLAIYTEDQGYYLNYYTGLDHEGDFSEAVLPKDFGLPVLQKLFDTGRWYAHNAKFDLHKMRNTLGLYVKRAQCTYIGERLIRNDKLDYSLKAVAPCYGLEKDMSVDTYIKEHGLYKKREFMGDVMDKSPEYYKVPFKILTKYACTDARLHLEIGKKQNEILG